MDTSKLQIVIPEQYRIFIPALLIKAPKTVNVGGRDVPLHDTLIKVFADGILNQEDALTIFAAFLGAPMHQAPAVAPSAPPLTFPAPVPTPPPTTKPWTPPTGSTPAPVSPQAQALALVAGLGIEFELQDTLENERRPIDYKITETAEAYEIELLNHGTTNFPLHGGAYLHAVYLDAQGVPINFERRGLPELYKTASWEARTVDGGPLGINLLEFAPALGRYIQVDQGMHIANWNNEAEEPREATRTGGMDVPVHFPDDANDRIVEITLLLPTGIKAKPIRFPKIS